MKLKSKVLFFISTPVPSEVEVALADKLTTSRRVVAFRNASQVNDSDSLERADYVCGEVPDRYLVEAKGWVIPQVIDLKQPELSFEPEPAAPASPMSSVATGSGEGSAPAAGAGEQSSTTTPPVEPTAEDIKAFSALNIDAVLAKVNAGEITREAAVKLEQLGKGRKSLIARLTETVD